MVLKLSDLVKSYRLKKGLSQKELARQLGVSQQAVGNIERGRALPRTSKTHRWAQVLGYSVEELNAAKFAQYHYNMSKGPSQPAVALEPVPDSTSNAGLALLAKLAAALAAGKLPLHKIELFENLLNTFLMPVGHVSLPPSVSA